MQLPPVVVLRQDEGQTLVAMAGVGASGAWSIPASAQGDWTGTVPWHIIERFRPDA